MHRAFYLLAEYVEQELFFQTDFQKFDDSIQVKFTGVDIQFDVSQTLTLLKTQFAQNQVEGVKTLVQLNKLFSASAPGNEVLEAMRAQAVNESGLFGQYLSHLLAGNSVAGGLGNDLLSAANPNTGSLLYGDAGNDEIVGGVIGDVLDGGSGDDKLRGGWGNDTFVFGLGYGQDTVWDQGGTDVITLGAGIAPTGVHLWRDASNLYLAIVGTTDVLKVMGWFDNTSTRVESVVFQDGTIWNTAKLAAASFDGTAGDDFMWGSADNDTLDGFAGNDSLNGNAGNDTYVFGIGYGRDVIADSAGTDVIALGAGITPASVHLWRDASHLYIGLIGTDDVLTVGGWFDAQANRVESIVFKDGTIWDTAILAAASIDGTAGDDFYIAGTAGNDFMNGLAGNDFLYGDAGDDVIDGGTGIDTLVGGLGNDTYIVDNASDMATENSGEGTDSVKASVSFTLSANVENLTLTGSANINATGNTGANVLTGNAGDNVLNGGAGADTMAGGLGNDTYVVDNTGDVVSEATNAGADLVQSSVSYTLGANVENLTLTGTTAVNGTGNADNNVLTGNSAANVLTGGAGNDTYVVGTGDTTIEAAGAGTDTVQSAISWTLATNVENLTLAGTAAINGTGNTLNNVLTGNTGNNVLDGGAGGDTMAGGTGNDTYYVDNAADVTTEAVSAGTDTVISSINWTLATNLENLTLSGSANINATGNTVANVLTGNAGANVLNGGAGADTMAGGMGNDNYVVDNTADVVSEAANAGTDLVQSSVTYTLATNVENLTLTGTAAVNGTGNTAANVLTGNTGANTLTGGAGNDTLNGGASADALVGGTGNDTYWLGRAYGADTITENDTTSGNTDVARFDVGIAADQLWFTKTGNNLDVSIIGTTDKFTLSNWYLGNQYHVEQFKTSDGKTLLDSQVQNLVQAMASFAPPAVGQTSLTPVQQTALAPVIAANWQ